MQFLRQNTAVMVTVGPFYDKTDGVTIKTALTITNEKLTLTADTDAGSAPTNILDNVTGATSGTANDLNYITGNDAGMMQLELAAADTNRVGRMTLSITDAANHVPVFHEYFVLPQAIFDWLTGVIVPLPANVTQLLGTAWLTPGTAGTPDVNVKLWNALTTVELPLVPTTAGRKLDVSAGGEAGVDWANVGSPTTAVDLSGTTIKTTQKVDVDTIKTNPVVNAGTITFPTTATLASTTNITAGTIATVSGNVNGSVGSVTGLTASDVGAIKTQTDKLAFTVANQVDSNVLDWKSATAPAMTGDAFARIGAAGAGLTAVPWNASWDAEVQSEVQDALDGTIADSIPADGVRPSISQALYMLTQFMLERSVAATTVTVAKPDGTTALFTLTLNDGTTPTAITRAT
jgi:hypothetical protein